MSETTSQIRMDTVEKEEGIDFVSLLLIIWKSRKLIVFGTLGVTLLAVFISLVIPKKYLSTGFFQLGIGGIPITTTKGDNDLLMPSFKSSSMRVSNPERLINYASHKNNIGSLESISESFRTAADIRKWILPIYAHTREDAREMGNLPLDQKNVVIGVEVRFESDRYLRAHDVVGFLGEYLKDCLIYDHLFNYIQNGFNGAELELNRIENKLIGCHFSISQFTTKAIDIQSILAKYPDSARIEDRQLVSVQDGGHHYLPPAMQLVGIESTLADLRRELAEYERTKEKLTITRAFFSKCMDAMEKMDKSGEVLLSRLPIIKSDLIKDLDLSKDTTKEEINNISIAIQRFVNLYTHYRFISGPSVPNTPIKPNKRVIVTGAFFASFFLLIIMTVFLEWWRNNKENIRSAKIKNLKE